MNSSVPVSMRLVSFDCTQFIVLEVVCIAILPIHKDVILTMIAQ